MSIPMMVLLLLVLATGALAAYRKFVTREEDDLVHLGEGSVQHSAKQEQLAKTLAQLDKFTKILVTITVLYGLGLGATLIYQALQNGPTPS
jgi:heme oxygenase